MLRRSPKSLDRILNRAISNRAHDSPVGMCHLEADGRGQTEPQDAVRYRVEGSRFVQHEMAVEISFGRRALFGDDSVARHHFV